MKRWRTLPTLAILSSVFLLLISVFTGKALAGSQLLEVLPSQTALVSSYFPDSSYPNPEHLEVSFTQSEKLALFWFDLSPLPNKAKVLSATFSAYLESSSGDEEVNIELFEAGSDWCADDLSWNNKPALQPAATSSAVSATEGFFTWDVTELAQDWIGDPDRNSGIALGGDGANFTRSFSGINSKNKPRLDLTVQVNEAEEDMNSFLSTAESSRSGIESRLGCSSIDSGTNKINLAAVSHGLQPQNSDTTKAVLIIALLAIFTFFLAINIRSLTRKK